MRERERETFEAAKFGQMEASLRARLTRACLFSFPYQEIRHGSYTARWPEFYSGSSLSLHPQHTFALARTVESVRI
jgi:hypothetical protein